MSERTRISDSVFDSLRSAILSGELATGQRYSIYELAERFGVSRTPVRDAVLRLVATGMVEVERNRGIRITGLSVEDVRGVIEVRLLLEVPAAAYAADHATDELRSALRDGLSGMRSAGRRRDADAFVRFDRAVHDDILATLGNARLTAQVRALRDITTAMGASTLGRSREYEQIRAEHELIVAAIADRDGAGAARRMADHLIATGTLLMRQVAERTGEPVADDWSARVLGGLATIWTSGSRRARPGSR